LSLERCAERFAAALAANHDDTTDKKTIEQMTNFTNRSQKKRQGFRPAALDSRSPFLTNEARN